MGREGGWLIGKEKQKRGGSSRNFEIVVAGIVASGIVVVVVSVVV